MEKKYVLVLEYDTEEEQELAASNLWKDEKLPTPHYMSYFDYDADTECLDVVSVIEE